MDTLSAFGKEIYAMPPTGKLTVEDCLREIDRLKAERDQAVEARVGKLEDLTSKIYLQNENQSAILKQIHSEQKSIQVAINGPEDEAHKGIIVRLDRLEQTSKTQNWISKTTIGALIASAIAWFFSK